MVIDTVTFQLVSVRQTREAFSEDYDYCRLETNLISTVVGAKCELSASDSPDSWSMSSRLTNSKVL